MKKEIDADDYILLNRQLQSMIEGESYNISIMANACALLSDFLPNINWVGFYLLSARGDLYLGPFQGKVACMHIPSGKGVCGTALKENKTMRIEDVHQFPGHIACDALSASELVIPLRDKKGAVQSVLDIDSPLKNRFSENDQKYLELFCNILEEYLYREKN